MSWYESVFVDTGRAPALWLMIAFVLTFGLTRWITRRIRAGELRAAERASRDDAAPGEDTGGGLFSNIHLGGVHVHHQVWGIVLVLVTGLIEFRYAPDSPWVEILAALFGAGAALALDEFALWLHLEDVYWSAEGRKSIDAVLVAVVLGVAMLMQVNLFGLEEQTTESAWAVAIVLALHFTWVIIAVLKGKLKIGLVGIVVPVVALVAAIRLAKPTSFWAHRRYDEARMERARSRFSDHYQARWDRIRDSIGGQHGQRLQTALDRIVQEEIHKATVDEPAREASSR
ncbi:hypothetical protein [Demequina salsinemoris]|uniref:hypothetical protein n=1 Tax=Demequina salsinemoris TaxID=577470 RepID=UPI0007803A02|nr:hypothetical protein [Demequina salsinemoris]